MKFLGMSRHHFDENIIPICGTVDQSARLVILTMWILAPLVAKSWQLAEEVYMWII